MLLVIALSVFATTIGGTPVLNLLENNFINIINIAFVIYIIFEIVKNLKTLIHIKKRLQMGFFINHHEAWKKRSASQFIIYSILAVLFIFTLASIACNVRTIVGAITGGSNYELTLTTELPVVRLNDIEKLEIPVIRTYYTKDNNHLLSKVSVKYNVFIKENEINEEFVQDDMTWEGEVYTPSIHTNYYKVSIPFMVQGALSDILFKAENYFIGMPNDMISVEKLDCNGLDEVYYIPSGVNEENYFGLVVRKGNIILWMIYRGQKTRIEAVEASQALFE